ncbi:PadR family transcriptional regulator [Patescibacteria group bacterium]|nr:PadR family transcriptional regulator [Patescibacteria group bacterium]MCL5091332.1 PadR family transcriptional regulator [Patescibacteria group bacterium]
MRRSCGQVVVENFFEPCVLYLLMEQPGYGYELMRRLKTHCSCTVNIGNLYRGLGRLIKNKSITKKTVKSALGPKKIVYTITPRGRLQLQQWIAGLETQNKTLSRLITNYKKKYDSGNAKKLQRRSG